MLTRVGVPVELEAEPSAPDPEPATLICFSHLRWNFVFQRPQHLMSRFSRTMNVIFWEEPVEIGPRETAYLQIREAPDAPNVHVVVPHLPQGMPQDAREAALMRLLDAHVASVRGPLIAWYYTPMMLPFSRHLEADVTVFDAMDELSKFKFAPVKLLELEQELIDRSDIVFTGGSSLYEAKKDRHPNVHCFPSSVDRVHFLKARARQFEPADQEDLPRPRLGFYGVIDERFDIDLLDKVAEMRPNWSFVMVGPVVKIAPEDLPKRPNIHYLGAKTYPELPAYLSGWDVALMPFRSEDLPRPRLGFYGVIDERFDIDLLDKVAEMRPNWSFVMVGPVVKIAPEDLPKRPNIHYLGAKTYPELPAYLSGWDVALMPF